MSHQKILRNNFSCIAFISALSNAKLLQFLIVRFVLFNFIDVFCSLSLKDFIVQLNYLTIEVDT